MLITIVITLKEIKPVENVVRSNYDFLFIEISDSSCQI